MTKSALLLHLHFLLALPLACAAPSRALEWSRFRGPNGCGVGATAFVPDRLAPEDACWRTELPPGFSSPVLGDGVVFLTGHEERTLYTYCIDRESGVVRWRAEAPEPLAEEPRGPNSPVSSTPVTDGENVHVFFESFGLVSYDARGRERWRLPLEDFRTPYGMGTSPVLAGGVLLLQCDQDVGSHLLAVDAEDGAVRWRAERPGVTHGFSSPVVWTPADGEAEIVVSGSYQVAGYSLETGEKLWWVDGLAWQAKSVPVVDGDVLYVHSWMAAPTELGVRQVTVGWREAVAAHDGDGDGALQRAEVEPLGFDAVWFLYDLDADGALQEGEWDAILARAAARNGLWAIRLGGRGDVTETHRLWHHDRSLPNIPSPLVYRGVVYMIKDGGILSALSSASGEVLRAARVEGGDGTFFASPVAAGGRLITTTHDGRVAVLEAGGEWSTVSVSDFGEEIWATPALGEREIFVRTQAALYCFRT